MEDLATVRLAKAARHRSAYTIMLSHMKPCVYRVHYGGDSGYRPSNSTWVTVR